MPCCTSALQFGALASSSPTPSAFHRTMTDTAQPAAPPPFHPALLEPNVTSKDGQITCSRSQRRHSLAQLTNADTKPSFLTARAFIRSLPPISRGTKSTVPTVSSGELNLNHDNIRTAWFSFTTNIRWLPVRSTDNEPRTLINFRKAPCLFLERLHAGSTSDDVDQKVRISKYQGSNALMVQGNVKFRFISRQAEVVILAADGHHLDFGDY